MFNKKTTLKLMAMILGLGLTFNISTKVSATSNQVNWTNGNKMTLHRSAGRDRFDTCVQIFNEYTRTGVMPDTVILANGFNYADALAATPLVNKYNAPILITPSDKLDPRIEQCINKIKAKKVIIVGGTKSISLQLEQQFKNKGLLVTRLAGRDRTQTSIAIARNVMKDNPYITGLTIADGYDFRDTLSIAPYSALTHTPIILTSPKTDFRFKDIEGLKELIDEYSSKRNEFDVDIKFKTNFEDIKKDYKDVRDMALDSDDYIYKNIVRATNHHEYGGIDYAIMTSPKDFPDSLCATALAVKYNAPILFVGGSREKFLKGVEDYNKAKMIQVHFTDIYFAVKDTYYIGGTKLVPEDAYKKMTGTW